MSHIKYFVAFLLFLDFIAALNNNLNDIIQSHENSSISLKSNDGKVDLTSLKFVYIEGKERYMGFGNIIFKDSNLCESLTGNTINCIFSPIIPTKDTYYTHTMNEKTITCPKTHISVLSEDKDAEYFICYISPIHKYSYYINVEDIAEEYKGKDEVDEETAIVGIIFGCSVIMAIAIFCCCWRHIRNRDKVQCNCNSSTAVTDASYYSKVEPVQGIPIENIPVESDPVDTIPIQPASIGNINVQAIPVVVQPVYVNNQSHGNGKGTIVDLNDCGGSGSKILLPSSNNNNRNRNI